MWKEYHNTRFKFHSDGMAEHCMFYVAAAARGGFVWHKRPRDRSLVYFMLDQGDHQSCDQLIIIIIIRECRTPVFVLRFCQTRFVCVFVQFLKLAELCCNIFMNSSLLETSRSIIYTFREVRMLLYR